MSPTPKKRFKPWTVSAKARKAFHYTRLVHIYISMALLALLIFFSVTGILINHTEWISSKSEDGSLAEDLPAEVASSWAAYDWEAADALPDTSLLMGHFRKQHGLGSPKEVKVDNEMRELTFDYQMPSAYVFIIASAEDNSLRYEYRVFGFWQLMGDLHKGRNSGRVWSWIIDISAVGMILFGITGLFILLQNLKHRRIGLLISIAGLLLPVLTYLAFVPQFKGY